MANPTFVLFYYWNGISKQNLSVSDRIWYNQMNNTIYRTIKILVNDILYIYCICISIVYQYTANTAKTLTVLEMTTRLSILNMNVMFIQMNINQRVYSHDNPFN